MSEGQQLGVDMANNFDDAVQPHAGMAESSDRFRSDVKKRCAILPMTTICREWHLK
jgi:hypothetical protein